MQMIGYCRVSTREQGDSRNGLDVQRRELVAFADTHGFDLLRIDDEVASGGLDLPRRPVLAQCVADAKKLRCVLAVSKLDRFSRSVSFVSSQMESLKAAKVLFYSVEHGIDVDPFLLHLYASLAEKERMLIGHRTRAALGALKARGVTLGNAISLPIAQAKGRATIAAQADQWASKMRPIVQPMRAQGMTLQAIADRLNEYQTPTVKGGRWSAASVRNLTLRWD